MYIFDEETIRGDDLTSELKQERLEIVKTLPAGVDVDGERVKEVKIHVEFILKAKQAFLPFEEIEISEDCPFVFDGNQVKMYDGMVDALAATENLLEKLGTPDEDGFVMLIRLNAPVLSNDPVVLGRDVIKVSVSDIFNSDTDTEMKISFNLSDTTTDELTSLRDKIRQAFSLASVDDDIQIEDARTSGVQYYELTLTAWRAGGTAQINTAIFNYLIMNDPVMSLLYSVSGNKNKQQKLRIIRRNKQRDFVELIQLSADCSNSSGCNIGIYFSVDSGSTSKKVLEKIIATLNYYGSKEESIRRFYDKFSVGGKKLLRGFDLESAQDLAPASFNKRGKQYNKDERTDIDASEQNLRNKLDCVVAMQNNPGISFKTLRALASQVQLDPRRWCDAASAGNKIDLYLFNENGIIIPRSKLGLYRRNPSPPNTHAVFIFVKKAFGCMLLVKKKHNAIVTITKKLENLNENYTEDPRNKKLACAPPAIKIILGDDYLICPVTRGDKLSGILQCIKAATAADPSFDYISLFSTASDDAKHAKEMLDTMSLFRAGGNPVPISNTPPGIEMQSVDEHGKKCGRGDDQYSVSAPIAGVNASTYDIDGKSYVEAFTDAKRENQLLMQICLFALSTYINKEKNSDILKGFVNANSSMDEKLDAYKWLENSVSEFVKEHVKQRPVNYYKFNHLLKQNDIKMIRVPNIEAITFFLRQSIKEPTMLITYINRIFLEDYFQRGSFRDADILHMPASHYSKWRRMQQIQRPTRVSF